MKTVHYAVSLKIEGIFFEDLPIMIDGNRYNTIDSTYKDLDCEYRFSLIN